ncbi:MAG: hypothetical protein A3G34_03120 [Candidatus Lindowbacteria bacterium RIFCSPLOWO2_12_FULL_62_27]|nr:MAG: hypothetical protein A3I06_08295 [Candidatus Lindowbacteria bacterium RIFCSPLOWO2_02_FULL_62_12]OGH59289.1 MAG: hypothetical protein A3G34_03120 [Candidatus Lindowbacteria bacterium RIFCSPLOWO2_12_FULL_62_27]
MNQSKHIDVAVLGGGFAGCAAALRLAQRGVGTALIEYKAHLGGRATSYQIKNWPAPLDNGQHVLLGCCDRTRGFLEALGAPDAVDWRRTLPVANSVGGIHALRPWPVLPPFHLIPFLRDFPGLGFADRAKIAWAMLRLSFSGASRETWGELAARLGQTQEIQRRFWRPFLVSALNFDPAQSAADHVRHIVRDAFLRRDGMNIGLPRMPLIQLFNERIRPALEREGVVLKTAKRILRLSLEGPHGFVVHLHDQSALNARKVILATGPAAAKHILEETTGVEETAKRLGPFTLGSPIISIHLLYDRVLTDLRFCLVQGKMIQWIFNKGVYDGRQHLQAVISAADREAEQSQWELAIAADAEVRSIFGTAAQLVQSVSFIEKNATFPPRPDLVRPAPRDSGHPDLFLAGDYVETGWPGTIESAVRSGEAAAEAVAAAI